MKNLFRQNPPEDLIKRVLEVVGWKTYRDQHKAHLKSVDEANAALTELWPYYQPCWARVYLKANPTLKEYMTIVRQILRTINKSIVAVERRVDYKSRTFYYLERPTKVFHTETPLAASLLVKFD